MSTRNRQKPETVALTREEVRACLVEGRFVREELEKRIAKMHELTIEERFAKAK